MALKIFSWFRTLENIGRDLLTNLKTDKIAWEKSVLDMMVDTNWTQKHVLR